MCKEAIKMEDYIILKGITKSFYNVKVLDNVSLTIKKGEVHAIIGENGAGKSTLMKILSGVYSKDAGDIIIDGRNVNILSPRDAQKFGIATIFQEIDLIRDMTVAENIFLGREFKKGLLIDYDKMYEKTKEIFEQIGFNIKPNEVVKNLGIAEQQIVEIAKALSLNAQILIMDEPTAVLTDREIEKLFSLMRALRNNGVTILYISHRLKEIIDICDRVTVLRDGKYIATNDIKNVNERELIKLMVGRELSELYPEHELKNDDELLCIKNLSNNYDKNISFKLYRGQVLGIAGLVGAGRTELAETLFGVREKIDGEIYINGKLVDIKSPEDALKAGICLIPEDRKYFGLVLDMSIKNNISLSSLNIFTRLNLINEKKECLVTSDITEKLKIKMTNKNESVKYLSGGNQQKVVLGKWILKDPEIYIMDEPTRGIDVGAKREIYYLINELSKLGKAIIIISSELQELLGLCDQILVMHQGRIMGMFNKNEATEENIMLCATGLLERSAAN
jgi:ribose transport system ATP-binding protein